MDGFLGDSVRFEIDDSDPHRFQQCAVHNALQEHLLSLQALTVMAAVIQNGKLKFPQAGRSPAEFVANVCPEKTGELFPADQFSLFFRQKALVCQTLYFLRYRLEVAAVLVFQIL